MNTSPVPPEHCYLKLKEWRSLNKGTKKQRKEPLSGKRKQSSTTEARKDTLNLTAQNRSSIMMTQMIKTTRLTKASQGRKNISKNKSVQFANINESTDEESGNESVCATQYYFSFNTHAQPTNDLRRMILLDNQSTCDIFCNSKLLSGINKTPKTMQVIGNGGLITTNRQGHLKITVAFSSINEPSPTSCA